jgi:periplasmic copper chaperone A
MDQSDMSGSGGMENKSGSNSAAYLVIQNNSSQPDRLLNAYSELALSTEIHVSEDNNGVMSMRPVDGVDVPARGKVELKPGSYHIMLVNISRDLIPGEILKLTLEFQSAGKIEVQADVRAP